MRRERTTVKVSKPVGKTTPKKKKKDIYLFVFLTSKKPLRFVSKNYAIGSVGTVRTK